MILQGDALTMLRTLPDASVQMAVTSPPYWNLRDYNVAGQLGLERSYDEYIGKLCARKRIIAPIILINIVLRYILLLLH